MRQPRDVFYLPFICRYSVCIGRRATDASLAQKQSALTALLRLSDRIRHYGVARTQRFLALDCRVTRSLVLNL